MSVTLHATCVAIRGVGVLLTGPPGSGKSDLALRLIDRGAELVSDDGTIVTAQDGRLIASAPATIAGLIEARGLAILARPALAAAPLALCLALDRTPVRLPDAPLPTRLIEGVALPLLALAPFEASAAIKVEQALLLQETGA